jgi:hypothetical protein
VLKVRLLAPLTYRVARVREQRQMDGIAYLYITKVDDIRRAACGVLRGRLARSTAV